MVSNTFQMLKTSIFLVQDFEDHIHCLRPGVLWNNQLKYVWNQAKWVRSKSIVERTMFRRWRYSDLCEKCRLPSYAWCDKGPYSDPEGGAEGPLRWPKVWWWTKKTRSHPEQRYRMSSLAHWPGLTPIQTLLRHFVGLKMSKYEQIFFWSGFTKKYVLIICLV